MSKIKIAVDPSNIWEEWGNLRFVLTNMSLDTDNFELYITTESTNVELITTVATALSLDMTTRVFYSIADDIALDAKLNTLGIEIFLSGDYELVKLVNDNTTAYAVIVNAIQDSYSIQPKWFTVMNFWIERIDDSNNDQGEDC